VCIQRVEGVFIPSSGVRASPVVRRGRLFYKIALSKGVLIALITRRPPSYKQLLQAGVTGAMAAGEPVSSYGLVHRYLTSLLAYLMSINPKAVAVTVLAL